MDQPPLSFGDHLRRLRNARGLSLREFAKVTNHSKSLLGDWEIAGKVPSVDVAQRLDDLLHAGGVLVTAAAVATPAVVVERLVSEVIRYFAHQGPIAEEIRRRAVDAEYLDILAVRGLGILGLNDSLLWPVFIKRAVPLKVRVLLLDPDCEAAAQRAREIRESTAAFAAGIKLTLARLEELEAATANVDLDVSLYGSLPIWRIIRVDETQWVSSFSADWEGHESTIYEIPHTPRGSLSAGYRRQFDDIHAHASRVI